MAAYFQFLDTKAMIPTIKLLAAHFVNICLMSVLLAALSFGLIVVSSAITVELSRLSETLSFPTTEPGR